MAISTVDKRVRISSYKSRSPKNPANTFLVLYGADDQEMQLMFSHKETLKSLGFRYFAQNKTYSLFSGRLTRHAKAKLTHLGVDLGGYMADPTHDSGTPTTIEKAGGPEHPALESMHARLGKILSKKTPCSKINRAVLIDAIEKMIDEVARGTDKAAKQAFIRQFLEFSSRFYTYSAFNQMLIWIQTRGTAQYVAGAKKWQRDFGRDVSQWDKAITVFAPVPLKKELVDPETAASESTERVIFRPQKVFDVSATKVIPGHKKRFEPISRKMWSRDTNEESAEILRLVAAITNYATGRGITITKEAMDSEKGGYSAGGRIAINRRFKGMKLLRVLVHELAHELLHWNRKKGKIAGRKEKEIDAETTACIVLKHFGFETKDSTNYLALWRASGADVRARRKHIQQAAMQIIEGVKESGSTIPPNAAVVGRGRSKKMACVSP
jgi:hypothetical protein